VPQQIRAQAMRSRLLAAAASCFARLGYDQTSVDLICHEAGASKGAFYHHFPSKQSLFIALIEEWLADLDEQMHAFEATSETVPEAMQRMAALLGQVFAMARGQLPLVLEFWSQARRDVAVWERTVAPLHHYRARFRELAERGMAEGSMATIDPEAFAATIVSVAMGFILQALLDPDAADWGDLAVRSVDLYVASLGRRSVPDGANMHGVCQ